MNVLERQFAQTVAEHKSTIYTVCYMFSQDADEVNDQRPMLFLDEVQNIDGWEKFARRMADAKYRVWITDSNAKMLSSEIMTTLGGRYLTT